jgi:hypothetical protein
MLQTVVQTLLLGGLRPGTHAALTPSGGGTGNLVAAAFDSAKALLAFGVVESSLRARVRPYAVRATDAVAAGALSRDAPQWMRAGLVIAETALAIVLGWLGLFSFPFWVFAGGAVWVMRMVLNGRPEP